MNTALTKLPRRGLMALVHGYRLLLRPWLGNVCRFEPSCSAYALQALQQHGALGGMALTAARVLRCHPWCAAGHDPVPAHFPRLAAGLFTRLRLAPPRDPAASDLRDLTRNPP